MTPIKERAPWLQDIARDLPAVMTLDEAANILRMSSRTLRRLIANHTISSLRRIPGDGSSRVTIPRAAVLDYLEQCEARW